MSKRQKGRKHRTVNRTPRPVGPAVRARSVRATAADRTGADKTVPDRTAAAGTAAAHGQAGRAEAPAARPLPAPGGTPRGIPETTPEKGPGKPEQGPESAPQPAAGSEAAEELFRTPARDGGLGQSAGRTWERVRAAGASGTTVEELSASVGYQERTVLKHLLGLAEHGLAEQHGPGRWRPVTEGTAEAGDGRHGTPDRSRVPQGA
ncbi:helix-turn-helix transcriptional regulator [Streptomyces sp. NPDC007083]|uniref:helix-turn-helix transcriptional regulator n=1 Tax=Streptomyces sp. NPDC007083 TaxID=3156913 RepID=UPI0033DF28BA